MITLADAYKIAKPVAEKTNQYTIDSCYEYKDYYAFGRKDKTGKHIVPCGCGPIAVRKSDTKLCIIDLDMKSFTLIARDYTNYTIISNEVGIPIREYVENELMALVG